MMKRALSVYGLLLIGCSQTPRIHIQGPPTIPDSEQQSPTDSGQARMADVNLARLPEPKADDCLSTNLWTVCRKGRWQATAEINAIRSLCYSTDENRELVQRGKLTWQDTIYADKESISEWDYERCQRAGLCPDKAALSRPPDMVPNRPALGLTKVGAIAYCEGLGKRLPTASEWVLLGGCGDNEKERWVRCIAEPPSTARTADPKTQNYARQYAKKIRSDYLSGTKKTGVKARGDLCRQACRQGVPWIACDPHFANNYGHPPVKTKSGFSIDDTYKGSERVAALLHGYKREFPKITNLSTVGYSNQGRPILALRISRQADKDNGKPAVLLNGAHHGDELLAVDYAIDAIQTILSQRETPQVKRWLDELDIWVLPLVNPDGNHHTLFRSCKNNIGRKNGRDIDGDGRFTSGEGVDLNRNYPFKWGFLGEEGSKSEWRHHHYRGQDPASEPETKALIKLAERYHFVAAFSWHTNGRLILSPYTIRKVKNTAPDVAWKAAETLRAAMSRKTRRFRVQKDMYPVDGVDQDWHFYKNGTLAYIIEGTHHNPQSLATRKASVKTSKPLLSALLDFALDAPRVSGRVTDEQNRPLQATVMVEQVKTYEGERWMSRGIDGRFDRFVPVIGDYTIQVTKKGYAPQTVSVRAGPLDSTKTITIRLAAAKRP